ncbi:MAG: hypothetical protein QOE66_1292 [Chloroflexota bacterium]|jgi:hypothetical protein|nr:hypothetical protein [Chloroflexota bacterium]
MSLGGIAAGGRFADAPIDAQSLMSLGGITCQLGAAADAQIDA